MTDLPKWDEPSAPDSLITTQLKRYKKSSERWAKTGKKVGSTTVRSRKPARLTKTGDLPATGGSHQQPGNGR